MFVYHATRTRSGSDNNGRITVIDSDPPPVYRILRPIEITVRFRPPTVSLGDIGTHQEVDIVARRSVS
jgi:hypothetical protein